MIFILLRKCKKTASKLLEAEKKEEEDFEKCSLLIFYNVNHIDEKGLQKKYEKIKKNIKNLQNLYFVKNIKIIPKLWCSPYSVKFHLMQK